MNKTKVNIAFGKRLSELRRLKGFSQEAFAHKCNFDRTYIGILERGEKSPTLNTLDRIATSLEMTLSDLLKF